MRQSSRTSRRNILAATLVAGFGLTLGDRAEAQPVAGRSRTLVAYFTRTGNTKVIARKVHRDLAADLFKIAPAHAYPEDYEATVAQAEWERQAGYEPALENVVPEMGGYDTGDSLAVICRMAPGHDFAVRL